MEPSNHLQSLLQIQLASDASAVRHLPYCLSTLTKECLKPSAQSTKWTNRISSLLHSKESGARWAGLCLAYKSSLLSQKLMIDAAQSWISVALPLLSRNEPLPTVKAAVRLLRVIFSTAISVPEFHRQVSLPHIIKFTGALIPLADSHSDIELKVLCMETLTRLIPLYPTTHRASSTTLSGFTLRYLNGSPTGFTNEAILSAASQLYAVLPLTGGKVGATNLWRKSLDETLAFGWEAFYCLRTTFPTEGQFGERSAPGDEPQNNIPLNQDRLRCSIVILCDLFRSIVERPVQIPIGNLVKFITSLLASSADNEIPGFVDPIIRSMEVAVIPDIWKGGCELLVAVATTFPHRLDANANRLLSILAYHLEQTHSVHYRLPFVEAIDVLLKTSYPLHSPVLTNRLAKAILPSITKILSTSNDVEDMQASSSKSKNARKRARNYEGDEVFKITRQVVCTTAVDEQILLISIDVTKSLFSNPELSAPLHSLIARIMTSVLIALPKISPSSMSQDLGFIHILNSKIQDFSLTIGSGTTSAMSKTLPFVIESALTASDLRIQRDVGLLLHPRVPPLVRSMPHLEAISLFKVDQSQEEIDVLTTLEMKATDATHETEQQDVVMTDHSILVNPPTPTITTNTLPSTIPTAPVSVQPAATSAIPTPPKTDHASQSTTRASTPPVPPLRATGSFESYGESAPRVLPSRPAIPIPQDEGDEDDEMPAINMESDSEDDDV
ncbi:hypothetical protein HYPSUDRAFT_31915 [Hypholoma sublateritium FD-334 SS-4]|uniref:Pre-rRNA-processing protein RIX1 n=1 Tax=Hypholoma sublateritium (strain FD-334 SS-4) TaxID=945553 RepID=A0A0D2N0H4_HYPSF|nr:hypothetical protein HYPSUDRAFT_31915 [Hypholoma sublateritium FD-334 SS-4]